MRSIISICFKSFNISRSNVLNSIVIELSTTFTFCKEKAILTRMHSSRMRTGHLYTIFRSLLLLWGVLSPGGGVLSPEGVYLVPGVYLVLGACLVWGVSGPGGHV